MVDWKKLKDIPTSITEENSELRRARLAALSQIATAHKDLRGEPSEALNFILGLPAGSQRETPLKEFFKKYIPGGWIPPVDNYEAEDQVFLRNVQWAGNPFWWDFG
ncbi:MAG: hypothetical protein ACXADY_22615 [Candidatus Hodarchaeales archaeon]|jgi:hypothetical protein